MLNVYLAPLKFFLNDVLGAESINGCPLYTFSGLPCPFCGTGRVFESITGFRFMESFYYNPLGLIFYFFFGVTITVTGALSVFRKKISLKKPALKLWYLPLMFLILMWLLNILYGHHR